MNEASEFHLQEGLTFSFATVERQTVGFSVAGKKLDPDPRTHFGLQFAAAYALGGALALANGFERRSPVRLSQRQHDVLRWAAEGMTVDQIADRLRVSRNTVDTHLRAVRVKFGVGTTMQAVAEGIRNGVIA